MRLGLRRVTAWLIDWACILGWVLVTLAVGLPLYLTGVTHESNAVELNIMAALIMVVPVAVAAAILESRPGGATPGKRVLRLRVRNHGDAVGFARALGRNGLKIALPWLLGHAAVYAIVLTARGDGSTPAWVWILTGAAYVLPIAYIVSLFVGRGRTLYDRLTGTEVVRAPAGA
jgi:uncharacterized RDD family membrane protein YckC